MNKNITGTFDGQFMLGSDGKKYEVNPNYAAKSQLIYGTQLSLSIEDGKNFFKQIDKVEKQKIDGILSKKEGEWCLLTSSGVYKISSTAAKFQEAKEHMEATAYIPKDKSDVPFAALDSVKKDTSVKVESSILSEKYGKRVYDDKASAVKPEKLDSKPKDQINSLRTLTDDDLR